MKANLRTGELALIRRALRGYIHAEQLAIQEAALQARLTNAKRDALHAEDVRQHAGARIHAASMLLERLSPSFKQPD
jgi:hypothetical protein